MVTVKRIDPGTLNLKEQVVAINRVTKVVKGGKNVHEMTIPHQVLGVFASSQVLLKPAPPGTGVIAGGAVRAVITACGIPNVLTKSIGRRNPHNVVKAAIVALESLRDKTAVADMRGLAVEKL